MPLTTSHGYALIPLSTVENHEEIGEGQPTAYESFGRALIWTLCSATTLYSTKQLMTTHGFHYPLTIAFRAFASILVVFIILNRLSKEQSNASATKQWRWSFRKGDSSGLFFGNHSLEMIPASITAVISVPILLEGLLHMPSLPVVVMLFPLVYAVESLALFIFSSPRVQSLPCKVVLAVAASGVVLYNEYRLMVYGLTWSVTGTLLVGVSRALFTIGCEKLGSEAQGRLKAHHTFIISTLVFGILSSGVLMIWFEMAQFSHSITIKATVYSIFNMACFVCTAFSGSSLHAYTPLSLDAPQPLISDIPTRNLEILSSFVSSLLVLLISMYWNPLVVSWVQLVAYLTAVASLVGLEQLHSFIDSIYSYVNKSLRTSYSESQNRSRLLTLPSLFLAILATSWALSTLSTSSINALPRPLPSKLDTLYHPTTRFEIVVSMYDEAPSDIRSLLSALRSTTFLSTLTPTITLYTKNSSHYHPSLQSELKTQTGADHVEHLENRGREGGTYLHHIVTHWDSLAEQTMFIQAHAHNMRELIPRINSYLVPESGFLSLGFAGVSCWCGGCGDRWGWEDKAGVVPGLYERIYRTPCADETPVLLTYKGQFVASAWRLRGVSKGIYEELLETITGNRSMIAGEVDSEVIGWEGGVVGEDTPDNPHFGFTVERIWGLLGQCATDQRVAVKCPSLLSGMSRGGEARDCGCLDI